MPSLLVNGIYAIIFHVLAIQVTALDLQKSSAGTLPADNHPMTRFLIFADQYVGGVSTVWECSCDSASQPIHVAYHSLIKTMALGRHPAGSSSSRPCNHLVQSVWIYAQTCSARPLSVRGVVSGKHCVQRCLAGYRFPFCHGQLHA